MPSSLAGCVRGGDFCAGAPRGGRSSRGWVCAGSAHARRRNEEVGLSLPAQSLLKFESKQEGE